MLTTWEKNVFEVNTKLLSNLRSIVLIEVNKWINFGTCLVFEMP